MKKITQELLTRGFINNNINTPSKESMFVYIFNKAVEVANDKRNTKRLNRNRTSNRMGKSCINYK